MVLETALDLSMNEVIDKIGTEGSWVTPVTELTSPMEVTLGLDSSLGGYEDYIVVRQHGEEIERLETEYDSNTNSVTFETDRYSTYVIAHSENKVHVHSLAIKNAKAATCTEVGNTVYYTCSGCGKYFSDAAGTTEIAANSWIIPKKGHSLTKTAAVAATCTAAGNSEYYTCSGCGKYYSDAAGTTEIAANSWVISALGHDNQSKIVPATTSKDGYTADVCSRCGEVSNKVTISAIKTVTLKSTSVTYTGKTLKTAVTVKDKKGKTVSSKYYTVSYKNNKNVGKATVTIRFKGNYSGTVKKTFKIVPKATMISKVAAAKKGFKVTWKKQTSQTSGYEIQYSTDKNFKKAVKTVTIGKNKTTSKSITKLAAKKKYYVRIRTYKLVGKTKYYSDWSKISNVTTKK